MLSLSAAACAPLRMRSQNESPGTSCVIIATVTRGVSACPAPIPPPLLAGFPPVLEHDMRPRASTPAHATAANRSNFIVSPVCGCPTARPADDVTRVTSECQYFVKTLGLHVIRT